MKYLLLLLISSNAFAQGYDYTLPEEEINPPTEEILIKKPEKYLRHESMIYDLNTDLGIKDQRQYTGTDKNRLSISGQLSADYEHLAEVLGIEVTYMRRTERYDQIWWGFQAAQSGTRFDAIAEKQVDEAPTRPGNSKGGVTLLGMGVSYRFKLHLDFWQTEDWFQNIDVFGNYVRYNESFLDKTYQGYGLTTSYGLAKRSSTNYYYGPKLTYNLAPVRRDRLNDAETSKSARELTLGWLSFGFEIGIFY